MNTPKHMYWTYGPEYDHDVELPDPRLVIAKHIGWKKLHTPETEYRTPEPDNYNRAVFANTPIDCTIIEDQVIYYNKSTKSWITVMYVPDEQIIEVDSWIEQCRPQAHWVHLRAPKIKPERGMLWCRGNINENSQTDNERLYTMGYFDEFKVKYFSDDTTYVDSLLGEVRTSIKNLQPEVGELDEF